MRTSSNPAFRNLPGGQGGYAGFDDRLGGAAGATAAYRQMSSPAGLEGAPPTERPITVDDVVTKTAITAAVALIAGAFVAFTQLYFLGVIGGVVGLIVSLIIIFKQTPNKALVLTYSASMGMALGAISGVMSQRYAGIVPQAIIGTAGVFIGMLVVYKTGAVKVTPKLTKWVIGAVIGVGVLMVANLVAGLFGANLGLRDGSPLAIVFSLVVIGVAAFCLLLDFDQADQAIRAGLPANYAWYVAFGLMTTLVWLYVEILRLLSYLRGD